MKDLNKKIIILKLITVAVCIYVFASWAFFMYALVAYSYPVPLISYIFRTMFTHLFIFCFPGLLILPFFIIFVLFLLKNSNALKYYKKFKKFYIVNLIFSIPWVIIFTLMILGTFSMEWTDSRIGVWHDIFTFIVPALLPIIAYFIVLLILVILIYKNLKNYKGESKNES